MVLHKFWFDFIKTFQLIVNLVQLAYQASLFKK